MMRPLRRRGASADVLWDKGVVLARRSQTRGDEVREATKNSTRFRVTLPSDVMAILRWHVGRLPAGPMQGSDLLFPSDTGGFRSPTVLDKPFKDICKHLSLGKRVTPKAMRRTFQDLARVAAVDGLVQRSICGHLSEEMTERYSSVAQAEVEAALGKVVSLAGYRGLLRKTSGRKQKGGKTVWETDFDSNYSRHLTLASTSYSLTFLERNIGFERRPQLGKTKRAVSGRNGCAK